MPAPLLETKLYLPRPRDGAVRRPRLSERLERGSAAKLVLVSAPAGFGKTMLLAEWLATRPAGPTEGRAAAWLSLDRGDNSPATFWTYVIAALRTVAPEVGARELALLSSPQPPPIHPVLTTLLNDLVATGREIVLVLDDYHVIDSREVQDAVTFLLEHLPPRLHLVIASRADPAVPLARLRALGELLEIRASELRFTPDETAEYLSTVVGLQLGAPEVAALEERTEGWIAALQLAALSMQGRDDVAGFIAGFTGNDRYIVDYLVQEVLERQAPPVRDFLLRTSLLTRLNGALCDAVTGQDGGSSILASLERANLFLVPLDDQRRWYRYHHLFADVLHARLLDEQPGEVPDLNRRASAWYELNGEPPEAIRHALAAGDVARAADLVELAIPAMRRTRQEALMRRWLEALPDEMIRVRPVLSVECAAAAMVRGEVEGVEERLRDAERWLGTSIGVPREGRDQAAMVVADHRELERLPGAIALYRAGSALLRGDVRETEAHARRALGLVDDDDHLGRGGAATLLGLACWTSGDLEGAERWYGEGMASLERAGHLSDMLGAAIALADIRIAQGRIREAMRTFERGLEVATRLPGVVLRGAADMHVGMSSLLRERNHLDAALRHLSTSLELGEPAGLPQNPYRWRVAMSGVREAQGDVGGALDLLDEAERLYVGDFSPDVRPVPAVRARAWIRQGRLDEALGWARDRRLSVEDDLSYVQEYEHITLARALLARYARERAERDIDEVTELLERLLRAGEEGSRTGSVVEILVLQALAGRMRRSSPAALVSLDRALALAEPEGYVRVFVDEGALMAALLRAAAQRLTLHDYVGRLLTAFDGAGHRSASARRRLAEPLTERELDVLRLLRSDLGGPEIARELVVSLSTVRTHTRNIYAKLGVSTRRAAVRRAEELDLR
jgi:ATP/maltotriose-dependent transcriptional regulator MalT